MSAATSQAREIINKSIVIDTLGGAVVHPTPYVAEGTYEEHVVSYGWTAMNACLVSEPTYNATFEEVLAAIRRTIEQQRPPAKG